jgi:hypothetical protein
MKIRKPFISVMMTEYEARCLLELLDGIDRAGAQEVWLCAESVRAYDRLANRIRHARVRFPFSGEGRKAA